MIAINHTLVENGAGIPLLASASLHMDYDVIIVGARVAGSTLAALLGQQGHRVLLLDKAHLPSDTLSTHFFRAPVEREDLLLHLHSCRRLAPMTRAALQRRGLA